MMRWFFLVFLAASCRGKESGGAPVGSAANPTSSGTWSATIQVGNSTGVLGLGSGPIGTFVAGTRYDGATIVVNGKELLASSADEGEAYVQLAPNGEPVRAMVIRGTGVPPSFSVGTSDAATSVGMVEIGAKGAIAMLPGKTTIPVDGNPTALARSASNVIWLAGRNWGSDDPLATGRCDRHSFLARRAKDSVDIVDCDSGWDSMHLAVLGEDAVMCASGGTKIGGTEIEGTTFLARIGSDGKLKWLRYINEVGESVCEDVVVTSDGDVVATGKTNAMVDLSEGAKARGVKVPSSGGFGLGLDRLWLARYSGDGARRWARVIAESTVGFSADLDVDGGNALLISGVATSFDLGHGPVGPKDGATLVLSIDRDANVNGALRFSEHPNTERIAVDGDHGLVVAFAASAPLTLAGVRFEGTSREYMGVIRIPLPLPKP